jgi:hypothetical protein
MELEPGIINREPMPFGPRVSHDGMFAHFLEPLASTVNGGDAALFSHQQAIANNVADGLDETFATTIGAAEAIADNNRGAGDDQTAGVLVDNGGGVDAQRAASLPYLPQSDAPIEGNFRELPAFGEGHPGNGGISTDDPNKD